MKSIYLDNASTTKVYPQITKLINNFSEKEFGNPSSQHSLGESAKNHINKSRIYIASKINVKPNEISFTSGATESNNLAIQGLAKAFPFKKTIIISSIEHPSVNETCNFLQSQNYKIIRIPVNNEGILNLDILQKEIKINHDSILLVSIMHVNNIMGSVQDIERIGLICKLNSLIFHTDATQSFGKLNIDAKRQNITMLTASGHKMGAQKGIGLLYINEKIKISPLLYGGGQENNLRSGTENVSGIISLSKALEISKKINKNKIKAIKEKLSARLESIGAKINSSNQNTIYNIIHASFPNVDSDSLIQYLSHKKIFISTGSACDSKKEKESHVLKAINLNENLIKGSFRISLNEDIKDKDINIIIKEIEKAAKILQYSKIK